MNVVMLMFLEAKQILQLFHIVIASPECYSRAYLSPILSALSFFFVYLIQLLKVKTVSKSLLTKAILGFVFVFAIFGLFWWAWPSITSRNSFDRCQIAYTREAVLILYGSDMLLDITYSAIFLHRIRKSIYGTQTAIMIENPDAKLWKKFFAHSDIALVFVNFASAIRIASQWIDDTYLKFFLVNVLETIRAIIVSKNVRMLLVRNSKSPRPSAASNGSSMAGLQTRRNTFPDILSSP